MASGMSDSELRQKLKNHGVVAGPITETTRNVYLRKLHKIESDQVPKQNVISNSPRITRNSPAKPDTTVRTPTLLTNRDIEKPVVRLHSTNFTSTKETVASNAGPKNVGDSLSFDVGTRPTDVLSPSGGAQTSVSSKITTSSRLSLGRSSISSYEYTRPSNSVLVPEKFQTPTSVSAFGHQLSRGTTPQRAAGHTPTRKTYIYYGNEANSESETDDSADRASPFANTVSRVAGWLRRDNQSRISEVNRSLHNSSSTFTRPSVRSRFSLDHREDGRIQVSDTDQSDAESISRSQFVKRWQNSSRESQRDAGTTTSPGLLFTPPRTSDNTSTSLFRSSTSILSDDKDTDYQPDSFGRTKSTFHRRYQPEPSNSMGRFISGLVSHVPNLILVCSLTAFSLLCLSYLILKDHHGEVGKMADLQKIVCGSAISPGMMNTMELQGCLHQKDVTEALPMLSIAYEILSRYAGEYHCAASGLSSARMSVVAAQGLVEREWQATGQARDSNAFPRIWRNALFLLLHVGKIHFKLVAYDALGTELGGNSKPDDIYELESIQPYFTGMCRLLRWVRWFARMCVTVFWVLLAILTVVGLLLFVRWVRNRRIQLLEQKTARIRDLVAEVVHLLQQQLRENEANPDRPPYVPVYVLRDRLRQQHSDIPQLWPDIVRYVYEVETCIGVREWRGIGETWQWQGGTGWQGSALLDKSQKPPFVVPPTECLKIRNMFSTE
ncbi:Inner nuclear membrane protein Man1 (LEM domain-containing protein 3) [Paragonimus heterotremus]|uniref:Inner nuclear membrane protein Man1 (LEM domain-containing protein 3) n=1 Tax=Paragonimus heterotremus TaxID=100268 RepID=A0A8J4WPN6_9TREM|nr:Inner nuclear membrane protein Man1 (LEM domain-containing protein 3) [Paragonimus heterotremus]